MARSPLELLASLLQAVCCIAYIGILYYDTSIAPPVSHVINRAVNTLCLIGIFAPKWTILSMEILIIIFCGLTIRVVSFPEVPYSTLSRVCLGLAGITYVLQFVITWQSKDGEEEKEEAEEQEVKKRT